MNDSTADVVVVGAGIVGSAAAYRLAATGLRVVCVDANSRPGDGSTSASSAILRMHYALRENAAMAWDSYPAWLDWETELGGHDPDGMPRFKPTGALLLGASSTFTDMVGNFEALGIDYEILTTAAVQDRFPGIDTASFGPAKQLTDPEFWEDPAGPDLQGLFTQVGGYVNDPQRAAATYSWAACRTGAEFVFGRRVVEVLRGENRAKGVRLSNGDRIWTSVIVNAAGPASSRLNELAGVNGHAVTSRPLVTETHSVPAPPDFVGDQAPFVIDPDLGTAFRPDGKSHVHISSVEPECDPLLWADDPWGIDPRPTSEVYETQSTRVARRLPSLTVPNRATGLRALYDVTPDWNPLLDRSELRGFVLACGTSGNSFKTAPTIGEIVTEIVLDDLEDGPGVRRFMLPRAGHAISLRPYARDRTVASSRNVIA